jgi:predicted nucleotidyltransferase
LKFSRLLDEVFSAGSSVKVLRVLFGTGGDLSGRQIADLAQLDPVTGNAALRRLEGLSLVDVRPVGRARVFRLRRGNRVVARLLAPLFSGEQDFLPELIRQTAGEFGRSALSVILFGSVARGEDARGSDLDLCVVVNDEADLKALRKIADGETQRLADETDFIPSLLVLRQDEFRRRFRRKNSLIREIVREGIVQKGLPVTSILAGHDQAR